MWGEISEEQYARGRTYMRKSRIYHPGITHASLHSIATTGRARHPMLRRTRACSSLSLPSTRSTLRHPSRTSLDPAYRPGLALLVDWQLEMEGGRRADGGD